MGLDVGARLGPYRILGLLGTGGMGEVYHAHDDRLERDVALKILPSHTLAEPNARRRFRHEALVLSRLNHPNVATIYEFHTYDSIDVLAMEFIPGTTVRDMIASGPLPEKDVIRFGRQLVEGLAAAHAEKVIHRDLKPANLRVTPDGRLKILDFGLALLTRQPTETSTTRTGTTPLKGLAGTLPYMAPEQLRDEPADERTDLYSVGVVLYEISSGSPPFRRPSDVRLIDAILHEAPPALGSRNSAALNAIVAKALDKDPDRRYQTARDLVVDFMRLSDSGSAPVVPPPAAVLPWWRRRAVIAAGALAIALAAGYGYWRLQTGTGSPTRAQSEPVQSITILPFRNLSDSRAHDYFGLGIADVLAAKLTNARFLEVRAPRAPWTLLDPKVDHQKVGSDLGVDAVLTGSYQIEGEGLSVSYTLTDLRRNTQIAGDAFQDAFTNAISVEHRLAEHIVESLKMSAGSADTKRVTTSATNQNDAFSAYVRSRYEMELFWKEPSPAQLARVENELDKALLSDPRYTLALVNLATLHWISVFWGFTKDKDILDRAGREVELALQIDPEFGQAYAAKALVQFQRGQLDEVRQSLRQAFARSPNSALAYFAAGYYYLGRGLPDYGVRAFLRARELDPELVRREVGFAYRYGADFRRAEEQLRQDLDAHPDDAITIASLAAVLGTTGQLAEARKLQRTLPRVPDNASIMGLAALLDTLEKKPFAYDAWLKRFEDAYWSDGGYCANVAGVLAVAGRPTEAVRWLQRAGELSMKNYPFIVGNPLYERLKGQPSFDTYVAAVREEWQRETAQEERDPLMTALVKR